MSIFKRLIFALAILFVAPKVFSAPVESDLRSKTVLVHSNWSVAAQSSTSTILISLSSTSWPSPDGKRDYVNITGYSIQMDKLAASSATVKLGVITFVDLSTGSIKYFAVCGSTKNLSNTENSCYYESDNQFISLRVNRPFPVGFSYNDGVTPFFISNDLNSGVPTYQTDVVLPAVNIINGGMINQTLSGIGNIAPGLGDIVMVVQNADGSNAIGVSVDLLYHLDNR